MSKMYRYRAYIRWGQFFFSILLFVIAVVVAVKGVFIWVTDARVLALMPLFLAAILLIESAVIWWMYYCMAGTLLSIEDGLLVHTTRNGVKRYPLADLRLEPQLIPYMGGWLKIVAGKEKIRITVALEDMGAFLGELKDAMGRHGLGDHYDKAKMFTLMKTAVYTDQSWERIHTLIGRVVLLSLIGSINLALGYIFATLPSKLGVPLVITWLAFSAVSLCTVYVLSEVLFMRRMGKQSDSTTCTIAPRDIAHERRIFGRATFVGVLIYTLVGLGVLAVAIITRITGSWR